jgi:phosphatidylglycerol---prolipoprotein diacylglyceryl transferase
MPSGFTFLGISVKFYGLIIAFSFVLGVFLISFFAKRKGYHKDLPYDLVILLFPTAIIGARIYYILFSGRSWTFAEMIDLKSGGLAIYGGVIAGFIALIIYGRVKKIKTIKLTDIVVPALIIGQVLGRWGNFFNQEAYGSLITNSNLQFFPFGVLIPSDNFTSEAMQAVISAFGSVPEEAWFMATFFYESMWNLVGFFIITAIYLKTNKKGFATSLYLIYYGIGRFLIEGLRTDSLYVGNTNLRVSQLLSAILVIIGIILFVYYYQKQNYKSKKLGAKADAKF